MAIADSEAAPDERGFDELYRRYRRWLTAVVRRRGGGDATEDIVHETYVRIAAMAADQPVRHPKALLLTVARRLLVDGQRSASRETEGLRAMAGMALSDPGALDGQFETVLLRQVILDLPQRYRDVFVLHRFGGMSYQAIAKARGLTVKAVEWRVTKAMAMCSAKLCE